MECLVKLGGNSVLRLFAFSDLHGNVEALRKMLRSVEDHFSITS